MSTMNQPEVMVEITSAAATEVMKFIDQEGVDPAKGGLRVSVSARRMQRLQVRPADRGRGRRRRSHRRSGRLARVRRSVLGTVSERRHDRLCHVDAGLGLHVQEPELHGRLRLRQLVLRRNIRTAQVYMERSVAGSGRDAVVMETGGARDSMSRGPSRVSHAASAGERIRTVVVEDHEDIARLVANRIATLIRERNATGEHTVLGLATGSTPIGVYRELIRMHRDEELSFANVVTFNLDEYYPMPREMT